MKKKLAFIGGLVVVAFLVIPNALVLAIIGDDSDTDFINLLEYGLQGLIEYFKFIVQMYEVALDAGTTVT